MKRKTTPDDYWQSVYGAAEAKARGRGGPMHERRPDRKAMQLAKQVADTLNYVLSGETHDDVLRNLYVVRVDPAPNASQLMVTVAPLDPADGERADVILARLIAQAGRLRSEVAESIHRRKAPQLVFRVIAPPTGADAEDGET